jgi:hypothetical protein
MLFRRYVESQLVDDRARRALLEEELEEDTPQESLFLLRQSFESLRTIVDSLLKLETVSFRVFHEVGNLALRAILQNQYFRPFRPLEFCIEFDRVKSVPVLDALRRLGDPERRLFTTAFLGLFRLLHYLAYVRPAPRGVDRRSRVVLSLVRSESLTLVGYLKTEVAARSGLRRHQGAAMRVARDLSRLAEASGRCSGRAHCRRRVHLRSTGLGGDHGPATPQRSLGLHPAGPRNGGGAGPSTR